MENDKPWVVHGQVAACLHEFWSQQLLTMMGEAGISVSRNTRDDRRKVLTVQVPAWAIREWVRRTMSGYADQDDVYKVTLLNWAKLLVERLEVLPWLAIVPNRVVEDARGPQGLVLGDGTGNPTCETVEATRGSQAPVLGDSRPWASFALGLPSEMGSWGGYLPGDPKGFGEWRLEVCRRIGEAVALAWRCSSEGDVGVGAITVTREAIVVVARDEKHPVGHLVGLMHNVLNPQQVEPRRATVHSWVGKAVVVAVEGAVRGLPPVPKFEEGLVVREAMKYVAALRAYWNNRADGTGGVLAQMADEGRNHLVRAVDALVRAQGGDTKDKG